MGPADKDRVPLCGGGTPDGCLTTRFAKVGGLALDDVLQVLLLGVVLGKHSLNLRRFVAARGQERGEFGATLGDGFRRGVGIPFGLGYIEHDVAVFLIGDFGEGLGDELGRHLFGTQLVDDFQSAPFLVPQLA